MSKQLRINGEVIDVKEFVWDECHKIYLLTTMNSRDECVERGYQPFPVSELPRVWGESCPLRYISPADLVGPDYVSQCKDATVTWS